MPIEFHCTNCGKLLRTADETAGRAAKCPACGSVMNVPERPAAKMGQAAYMPVGEPFDEPRGEINPYQAPGEDVGMSPFQSSVAPSERVRAPAICLIVMSTMGLIAYLGIALLYGGIYLALLDDPQFVNAPPDASFGLLFWIGYGVVGLGMMLVTFFGAIKMKNLQSYGLAVTGAVLMVIPCLSPCMVLGIPFGIWAIVVLADGEVRAAFR